METDIKEQNDVSGGKSMETPVIVNVDGAITSDGSISDNQLQHEQCSTQGGARTGRPQEEKERTKLRERQRRAITARILAGLRRHGNYNLRVRADINDVIAALAREAGWVVLPDGTTFPSKSQVSKAAGCSSHMVATTSTPRMVPPQTPAAPLRGVSSSYRSLLEDNACHVKDFDAPTSSPYDSTSSRSHSTDMLGDELAQTENHPLVGNSMPMVAVSSNKEHDYSGTAYVPVYVMLPLGVVNMKSEVADPDGLLNQLRLLKSVDVDGVMVDCWWGIVEARTPQEYNWNGYRMLFQIVHELKFKLQVVMSFHECGGNIGDDVCIPLPHWVAEIGRSNLDIFFADREGRHNPECLSWGIDRERVLGGRTAIEVYFDFMRSFRVEFDDLFEAGIISMVELGLGPCGELRYPSYPVKHGWRYPGIGEFQCYDQYLLRSLRKAAEARGHPFWARGPDNAGSYNSRSHETGFFCDGGDYDGYYGRFFLNWYSQVLVDHADQILSLAKLVFEGTCIAAKLSGIYWWYKTASHAAELTAGFYNSSNRDGYAAIMTVLKKHGAAVNLTWAELQTLQLHEDFTESLADPEGLIWQVLNAAWDAGIPVTSENSVPCNDRESYNRILENAKPYNDPDGRHFAAFTYLRLSPILMERHNFIEFERFIKRMHGEVVVDLQ